MTPCFATLKRRMLTVTLALFLAQQWLGSAEAVAAGIVPAPNAPAANHPLTDTARNGVPIVDIAPPSAAGVSNNQYSQFNTASNGAILNNSTGNVQTQLGGWISGNPLLGSTPAKVILNQVTSGNPSQLLGALEVAGQAADVVVANPAGIACNGCSFINTPHATLTTGIPEFDAAGNLRGFNVTQGVIDVGAAGLDAQQAERLDLDARGLTAEGGIWAHQLGVVAGAADVPYGSTQASAQAGAGSAPEFAVDVAALGGMYADTIDLVATDAGLGVNSQGRLAALQGNLRLAANGKLTLADTSAAGNVQLSGTDASLGGTTGSTGGAVQVGVSGTLSNSGQVLAAGDVRMQAGELTNTGSVQADGALDASAGAGLDNAGGKLQAAGNLDLTAATLDNDGGTLASGAAASLSAAQGLSNQCGTISSVGTLVVDAGSASLNNASGTLASAGAASVTAGTLSNAHGTIAAASDLGITSAALDDTGGKLQSAGNLSLNTQGQALDNTTGRIEAAGTLGVRSGDLVNSGGILASGGDQSLNVAGNLNGAGGSIASQGELQLSVGGTLSNAGGTLAAGQDVTLAANSLDNTAGTLSAQHQLQASAATLDNSGGTIVGGSGLRLSTASSSFGGTLNSAGTVNLTESGAYVNTGTVSTQGDLNLQAQSITNAAGATLASGGNLSATTTGDLDNAGTVDAAGSTTLAVGGTLNNTGLIDSGAATTLSAATLDNTGRIYGGTVSITAASLSNSGGAVLASRGDMAIAAGTLGNTGDSTILALGALRIAGSFDPATGTATSATANLLNASSTIQAGGDLSIDAASVTNRNDRLVQGSTTSTQSVPDTVLEVQGTSPATGLLDASTLGYVATGNPVDHSRGYWVLPSTRYPISVFGAAPLQQEIVTDCSGVSADGLGSCTTSYTYPATSSVWQEFGVTPPPQAPVPPAGAPSYSGSDAQGNVTIVSCADPSTGQAILTGACGTYWQQEDVYQSSTAQAQNSLDQAITAFNADQSSRIISQYVEYHVDSQTTVTPTVVSTDPARILAGGNLTVSGGGAGSLLNADSEIVAGGNLDIATGVLQNQSTTGTQTVTGSGPVEVWASDGGGTVSSAHLRCNGWNTPPCGPGATYTTQSSTALDLNTVTVAAGGNPGTGSAPAATPVTPSHAAAVADAPPSLRQVSVPAAGGTTQVSTLAQSLGLPASQLFRVDGAPNAPYVVETDPAFTNQQNFLSSNYYLQQLNIDPSQWQLRYGDGFAEQQLVQNQILALTGRDILADYSSTQTEYQALMNAGVAYAKAYGIAPGVSLSAAQMALVTTDMVLLTTQTLTLPDGTTEQVLVPQVYLAHPQGQDLTQGGALLAGGTVTLTTAQDLSNSGTVSGDTVQATAGHDLTNGGTIAGQNILLSASNDLQDLSGLVQGTSDTSSLSLLAGRDLLLQTQAVPVQGTGATAGTTSLGHVATVQGGSITLQAARDLVAQGAQVASAGDLTALAGRNLNVGAATTTYQFATSSQAGDTVAIQQSGSTQHGSTLSAGGNATLVAQGGDLTVQASQVAAGHDAVLSGRNVTIAAGVNSASDATQAQWSAGHATLADSSQSAAGAGVSAGNDLTVQAVGSGQAGSGDLTVTGASLSAQNGQATLQAAHDLSVGTLALSQSSSAQVHSESHGFLSSGSSTTNSSSSSTANVGSGVRGSSVTMTAGHDLNVLGSKVAGTGSRHGSGQVSLTAGNTLNVLAAANTQSAHSDTQSSGGLFGSDKAQSTAEQSQTTAQASSLTGSNIQLQSGSDMTLQAAQISGQSLHAQAGTLNGQVVDPNATLHIDAAIHDSSSSRSSSGHGLLTQSSSGQGQVRQTLQYTTIDVPGADKANGSVQLQATGGITVGASSLSPAGGTSNGTASGSGVPTITIDLKQQAQQLASQPGLGYLGPLSQRNDVAWQQVQLASQSWNYSHSGLTGVGAAIVAVAVACATGGMGAGLAGATAGTSTAAMANAAFTTLVTQASTALMANGGNLGAALRTLGSSASVKSLVASIATAGLENVQLAGGQSLNGMSGLSNLGQTGRSVFSGGVSDTTLEGITGRAVVSAGVNSAVLGQSFGQGLVDSVVADASAIGANGIGGTWGTTGTDPNAAAQALAHGVLGCAEAGLAGGHCAAGAAGAAAESVLGDVVTAAGGLPTDANGQVTTGAAAAYETGAAALGALAGQAAGGDAQSGLNTAVNSAANNYVYHASILPGTKSEAQQLQDAQAGCARGDSSACATATALTQTSTSRDQELATACQQPGSMGCLFQKSLAYLAGNTIGTVDGVTVATPEQTPVYTPPSQQAATLDNMLGSPLAGILGGITYAAGGSTSTAYYVTTLGVATDGIAAGVAGLGGTSSVDVVDVGSPAPASGLGVATNSNPVATEPDTAFFWSGRTNGIGGQAVAAQMAELNNGTTLETLIEQNEIQMPAWDATNPAVVRAWQNISAQYAAGASGSVRAVIGSNLRPGNVWETSELPALINNPKVTQITTIDPATGARKIIFKRGKK